MLGGPRGRRAALEGVAAIGVTSAAVNLGIKPIARRRRPDPGSGTSHGTRAVSMPESTSFPSGHSASAFAFAYAVGRHLPVLAVPIRLLAGGVAYSRVHTGVHYPGDVAIGSIVGAGTAAIVAAAADGVSRSRHRDRTVADTCCRHDRVAPRRGSGTVMSRRSDAEIPVAHEEC